MSTLAITVCDPHKSASVAASARCLEAKCGVQPCEKSTDRKLIERTVYTASMRYIIGNTTPSAPRVFELLSTVRCIGRLNCLTVNYLAVESATNNALPTPSAIPIHRLFCHYMVLRSTAQPFYLNSHYLQFCLSYLSYLLVTRRVLQVSSGKPL